MKKVIVIMYVFFMQVNANFDFNNLTFNDLKQDLLEFSKIYKKRPIKENEGGMKSVGMFWVWYITKNILPDLIIESGVWMGQSTWLLEQAAPQARIISIDPQLELRKYISDTVEYYSKDFSTIDFGDLSKLKTLAFFDDHQNAFLRVQQSFEYGVKYVLFDDNYPLGTGSHLTLQHCFNNIKNKAFANQLLKMIKSYIILPQLVGNKTITLFPPATHQVESLNLISEGELEIYKLDALSYRWTTFIEMY